MLILLISLKDTYQMPVEQVLRIQIVSFVELELYWF